MKKLVFSTLFVLQAFFVFAQQGTGITARVVDAKTQKPLQNVVASIQNTNLTQQTNVSGVFIFNEVPQGAQVLQIKSSGYKDQLLPLEIAANQILDLGVLVLEEDQQATDLGSSLISITESDLGDDNSGSESTASLLQSSRDVFQQAAAFNWGQARFKIRGLDNEYANTMINGISMNKFFDGRPQYSNWGGLNDALRSQEFTFGTSPSDYTFGGILGSSEINTRASMARKGNRISVAGTNNNYVGRLMGTMASGLMKDGWAYVISASRRFANEGYFEGTTYDANSFYASVEKQLGKKHSLNFTSIFGQNKRGKNSPNTQEVTDLMGEKYNSYWGWQDGEKRNSRIKTVEEPILMLNHYWKISQNTNINSGFAYQLGKIGNSRIDYQGVNNPDPTYYRNMPSYYTSLYENNTDEVLLTDPSVYNPGGLGGIYTPDYAGASTAKFLTSPQLDWESMYRANLNAKAAGEGSKYILYEDRTDEKRWTANTVISSQMSDNISFNGGGSFSRSKSHNFKNLLDLLGGDYYNDVTLFGSGDQRQSDLNNPNRTVGKSDTFGYNYNLYTTNYNGFTQFKFVYKKVDFYMGQTYSRTEYQREGLYKNGYYPTNSEGYSKKYSFDNFGFKGGFTYKINGKNYFTINGAYMTKAPTLRNVFNNSRVNNNITDGVGNETIKSADVSYIINTSRFKSRLTAFYSRIENQTETSFFFGDGVGIDDPATSTNEANAFVAETVTHMNKRNMGVELGMEFAITSTLKATAAGSYGEYIYDNNPNVSISVDSQASATNTNPLYNYGVAYIKNYKQSGMPQAAGSFGLEYRDPHYWNIGANINYLANSYIDIAPITRTDNFFRNPEPSTGGTFPEATQARADELLKQEKFQNFSLLNATGGKSWRIKGNTFGFFASVNNILDTKYKTGGFEQARNSNYRQLNQDVSSGTPSFGPKYFYGFGRTYFLNLYINF